MRVEITVIRCGSCENVMAAWHDADDAHEIAAYETGHYCNESGEYECVACRDARYADGMAMAAQYDSEQRIRWAREDDEAWSDSILSAADARYDAARDRGEI